MGRYLLCLLLTSSFFYFSVRFCLAVDVVSFSSELKDSDTLVSNNSIFRFGFFTPVNSTGRYAGIWFNNMPDLMQTVVWVANSDSPINDSSGVIVISNDGNLVVIDGRGRVHWSTNISLPVAANATYARLLDTGNLVLNGTTTNRNNILWESFEHPQNAFLPKMTLSTDARTGRSRKLRSWKSPSDPSPGRYSAGVIPLPFSELAIWKDDIMMWRSGPWNGQSFIGLQAGDSRINLCEFSLGLDNDNRGSVSISYANNDSLYHFHLDPKGYAVEKDWIKVKKEWRMGVMFPGDCDTYGKCGQFASCKSGSDPPCKCIRGFEPRSYAEWNRGNWTQGCIRKAPLQCERRDNNGSGEGDGFLRLNKMKVPNNPHRAEVNEQDCPESCLRNCSCTAYFFDGGLGCLLWSGNLIDMHEFLGSGGVPLHIRLAGSELKSSSNRSLVITISVVGCTFLIAVIVLLALRKVAKHREKNRNRRLLFERMEALNSNESGAISLNKNKLKELPLFEYQVLAAATGDFAITNKLGEGGFGPVYKGLLREGQEIAVKRLSRASGQGLDEFVNEVVVISKLQHRNLVRLLGFCIEGEERMLVYEFMPGNSLDAYLFDPVKQPLLDWKTRFNIINGICRGLMYLHRDSRLRIIHRDLKASNILLDENLNPKISDFGLARIFRGNEDEASTLRVVGTYGYMAPEYALGGLFSEKSDVFSLGVILLEIVSGRKNSSFYNDEQNLNLSAYAWRLWNDGDIIALVDPVILDESSENEIRRCVHIGLLCVQDHANDRPSVSTVTWMLSTENSDLPNPKQPTFVARRGSPDNASPWQSDRNTMSFTEITGR